MTTSRLCSTRITVTSRSRSRRMVLDHHVDVIGAEARRRLVEQDHLRAPNERACERQKLPAAAAQLRALRLPTLDERGKLGVGIPYLCAGPSGDADVLFHAQLREHPAVLGNQSDTQ